MEDSLMARLLRIVRAFAHALLGALEDLAPEEVIEQAMREVDLGVGELRSRWRHAVRAERSLRSQLVREQQTLSRLVLQVDAALEQGRDEPKKLAITCQLESERRVRELESRVAEARHDASDLERYLEAILRRRTSRRLEVQQFLTERQGEQLQQLTSEELDERRSLRGLYACQKVLARATGNELPQLRSLRDELGCLELEQLAWEQAVRDHSLEVGSRTAWLPSPETGSAPGPRALS